MRYLLEANYRRYVKENQNEINEPEEIIIPPEKRQQIIDDLRLFSAYYKNGIPKDYKLIRPHI